MYAAINNGVLLYVCKEYIMSELLLQTDIITGRLVMYHILLDRARFGNILPEILILIDWCMAVCPRVNNQQPAVSMTDRARFRNLLLEIFIDSCTSVQYSQG